MSFLLFLWKFRPYRCKSTFNYIKSYCISFFEFKSNMSFKSPNILIYTGNDCSQVFKNIENNILRCLGTSNYLIYHLLTSEVIVQAWMENTILLVISSDHLDESTAAVFQKYILNSGNVLLVCTKFSNLVGIKCMPYNMHSKKIIMVKFLNNMEITVIRGKYTYHSPENTVLFQDTCNNPVIYSYKHNEGILITSEIYIDRDFAKSLTECDMTEYDKELHLSILEHILTKQFLLKSKKDDCLISHTLSHGIYVSSKDIENSAHKQKNVENIFYNCLLNFQGADIKLPIYYMNQTNKKSLPFDKDLYFSNLYTKIYGHQLVYFPVISSTMDVANQLSDYDGIIVIASYQLSGKGRGENKWISPKGCAMFTLHFTLQISTNLGQKLSLIQHIAALAVIHGIRSKEEYKDINIKIKWPNDLYFEGLKFGGLIVTSTIQDKLAHVYIGWGINVDNTQPTTCINDAVRKYNIENSSQLSCFSIEQVIASTLSQIEFFIQDFQTHGSDKFFSYYYSYWLHSNQKVELEKTGEVTIQGLDEYGFLIVDNNKGEKLYLQPDGNRFDIMKNLIYSRKPSS